MQLLGLRVAFRLAAMALCASMARAEKVTLTGRVTDSAGQPVAGSEFGTYWLREKSRMRAGDSVVADAEGRFQFQVNYHGRPMALMALDPDQKRGAVFVLRTNRIDAPLELRLASLVTVRGQFTCSELGRPPNWSSAYLSVLPEKAQVIQDYSEPPRFELRAPPGAYELRGYGSSDVNGLHREITLAAEQSVLDLQSVDLTATPIGRHTGKAPPPWHVTEAHRVPRTVQVADYRGRWLLVEFWGFW